jgi:toxin YoeB
VKIWFSEDGWNDYLFWAGADPETLRRVNALIEDARRGPFSGLGKPEALKGDLSGWWSRRITREHRLIYRVKAMKGEDQRLEIIQCRYHY